MNITPGQVRGLILTNTPAQGSEIDVILQGESDRTLREAGAQIVEALESVKLAQFRPDADPRQPEIQIRPDWERVAALGLTTQDIGDTIQTAIEGSVPTQIQRGNRLVDVRVQFERESIKQPSQLESLPLFVQDNKQIRLADIATIATGQAPGEIQRINQRQAFIIAGNLSEGASLGDALKEVQQVVSTIQLPEGVSIVPSAAAKTNQELQNSLQLLGDSQLS